MPGPAPAKHEFNKGDRIYITCNPGTRAQLIETCKPLTVEHCTDKALLVSCGDSQQWFPLTALTPSTNTEGVYLLARWMKLRPEWKARTGTPLQDLRKRREKTKLQHADSST